MATASIILFNRNAALEGSSIYTSVYVYTILKIPVISSTWWPRSRFAFCQRRHFLQCQMGSRRKPLSWAATSALHIHPRASLILALRPHTHTAGLARAHTTENTHARTPTDARYWASAHVNMHCDWGSAKQQKQFICYVELGEEWELVIFTENKQFLISCD